jgi:hypothetical protein
MPPTAEIEVVFVRERLASSADVTAKPILDSAVLSVRLLRWRVYIWTHLRTSERALLNRHVVADDFSVSERVRAWICEVASFVDVPLESDAGQLADFDASLGTRRGIDEDLAELPPHVARKIEAWLTIGPDAEFVALTEPDPDRLLLRADVVEFDDAKPWNSRVPKRGLMREELEREARRLAYDGSS